MFDWKTLDGRRSTDPMYGRCKSLDGKEYAQVFTNNNDFANIYPLVRKLNSVQALRGF